MDPIIRRIAIRKGKVTDQTFRLFKMEWITDDTMLVEGSATVPFKSGPRKGKPNYVGTTTKTAVTKAERAAELILYETETGDCSRCLGKGVLANGWTKAGGTIFISCPRCLMGAKGKAPKHTEVLT